MNKNKIAILGFSIAVLVTSCRKTDMPHQEAAPAVETVAAKKDWTSAIAWNAAKQEKFTTYNGTIVDQAITSAVADKGLVLVFKKNGTDIQSLPFEEKGANDAYWYYQVSKGQIAISCDNYGAEQKVSDNAFQYFVITAEQLQALDAKGHSQIELLQLSYEEAAALLK